MAASLITSLPADGKPIFAGNLPDLVFSGIDPEEGMVFSISLIYNGPPGVSVLLNETIYGDASGKATLKIREVVSAAMHHNLPDANMFEQVNASATLTIYYDNLAKFIKVVKGGLLIPETNFTAFDYDTFFAANFLSWMPAERLVKYREHVWINYFNRISGTQLYVKAYFFNEVNKLQSSEIAIYAGMSVNSLYSFNLTFHQLITESGEDRGVFAFDVYVKGVAGVLSNIHRLTLINDFDEYDDVFGFTNSIGGYETIRFNGLLTEKENHVAKTYRMHNNHLIEFENVPERIMVKRTGYFDTEAQRKWLRDFFTSDFRHHLRFTESGFIYERITLISQKAEGARYIPNAYEFEFKYANQVAWQYHTREELLPVNAGDAVVPEDIGDLPDNQFNEDFLNQTPLNQITDETLSI